MFDFYQAMIELLDDYYGNSRDDDHKKEISDFIESNILEIREIIYSTIGG